jgi:hypothetical protein
MVCRSGRIGQSLAVLSLFAATACATYASTGGGDYAGGNGELVVQNRGWENVTVYAVRGPVAIRIGSVSGLSARTFALTPAILGPGGSMQLKGQRRISGEEFLTPAFDFGPGGNARWVIESTASLSHVMVLR